MYFDRWDIVEAYYAFASDYHAGQRSPEYAIFGRLYRMGYRPPVGGVGYLQLTDNGKDIYNSLVADLEG